MSTDIGGARDSVLPQAADLADLRADLESVLLTAELTRRTPRTPDYAAENKALVALAHELYLPGDIFQSLVEAAITLCCAHSAGPGGPRGLAVPSLGDGAALQASERCQ